MNPIHRGTDVHEIFTRAQRPTTWNELDNRVLLCNNCHIGIVHRDGAKVWVDRLTKMRKEWIEKFGS